MTPLGRKGTKCMPEAGTIEQNRVSYSGISRAFRPRARLRWWNSIVVDEAQNFNYDAWRALRYGLEYGRSAQAYFEATPIPDPNFLQKWAVFMDNWAQIGLAHERRVLCQTPLVLSAA